MEIEKLKVDLIQTLMRNMGLIINDLAENTKKIEYLEQRVNQMLEKKVEPEKIELTFESIDPETRYLYDVANGEYCKFIDTEHPGAYVIAILKSPYEKGKVVMCHALLVHEQNGVEILYVSDEILSAPYSNYSRGFCNFISKCISFNLRETYEKASLTGDDVKQINDYITKVGYTVVFDASATNTPFSYSASARLARPLFKTPKHRHCKRKGNK